MPKVYAGCVYFNPPSSTDSKADITRDELKQKINNGEFNGLKLCVNHVKEQPIGKIVEAYQDERDGSVYVRFEIDESTPAGKFAADNIGKTLVGLSLSHMAWDRTLNEVSLCGKGYRQNTFVLPDGQTFIEEPREDYVYSKPMCAISTDIAVNCSLTDLFGNNSYVNPNRDIDSLIEEMDKPSIVQPAATVVQPTTAQPAITQPSTTTVQSTTVQPAATQPATETPVESDISEKKRAELAITQLANSEDPNQKALYSLLTNLLDRQNLLEPMAAAMRNQVKARLEEKFKDFSPSIRESMTNKFLDDPVFIGDFIRTEQQNFFPPRSQVSVDSPALPRPQVPEVPPRSQLPIDIPRSQLPVEPAPKPPGQSNIRAQALLDKINFRTQTQLSEPMSRKRQLEDVPITASSERYEESKRQLDTVTDIYGDLPKRNAYFALYEKEIEERLNKLQCVDMSASGYRFSVDQIRADLKRAAQKESPPISLNTDKYQKWETKLTYN